MTQSTKTKHQKVIEGVDKFFSGLDTVIKALIRAILNFAGVIIDWLTTVLVGSIGYLGKQGTITIVNGIAFILSIVGAVWQFGRSVTFIFQAAHGLSGSGLSPGKLDLIFWVVIGVGAFLNYNQIQSRFWKFKDTVASQFKHLGNPGEGEIEPLTPRMVAEQRFSLAFRRREETTQLFYNVETGIYVLFVLALLFAGSSVTGMGLGAIVLEILLSMLALKLPELLLGLAEDNAAIWVAETQSEIVKTPTFNRQPWVSQDKTAPAPPVPVQPQNQPSTVDVPATPVTPKPQTAPPATQSQDPTPTPSPTEVKEAPTAATDKSKPTPKPKPVTKAKGGKSVTQF